MMWQKFEVILSPSDIIFSALEANLPHQDHIKTIHINDSRAVTSFAKIDLMIIDNISYRQFESYRINNVINLTSYKYTDSDISINLPLKLTELLQIVLLNRAKDQIFCEINCDWIYDEQSSKLSSNVSTIRFTEKENAVFKYLVLAKDHRASKEELSKIIWQYHPDINSATVEINISRLRQKLPTNLISFHNNHYKLAIDNSIEQVTK